MKSYEWIIPTLIIGGLIALNIDGCTSQRAGRIRTLDTLNLSGQKVRVVCQDNRFAPDGVAYLLYPDGTELYPAQIRTDEGKVVNLINYTPWRLNSF
jgi:hypothetical protein